MVYIDQNAARNPRFPLEPLFRALYAEQPGFQIGDVDLVTDRNNIRKLLRFVQGSSGNPFKIRVEIAGERTAQFTRVEAKTNEIIQGFRGFGHSFEDVYTLKEPGHSSHHRIVGYDFAGLRCIVRHETDGYVQNDNPGWPQIPVVNDLSDALGGLSLSSPDKPPKVAYGLNIIIVENGGKPVNVSSTLEIKTRAAHHQLDMVDVSPQLWISQTPKLAVGYHRHGIFDNMKVRDMTDELRQWETTHQQDLRGLAFLVVKIIDAIKDIPGRKDVVIYEGGTTLKISNADQGQCALPDDLYTKWEAKEEPEKAVSKSKGKDGEPGGTGDEKKAAGTPKVE